MLTLILAGDLLAVRQKVFQVPGLQERRMRYWSDLPRLVYATTFLYLQLDMFDFGVQQL